MSGVAGGIVPCCQRGFFFGFRAFSQRRAVNRPPRRIVRAVTGQVPRRGRAADLWRVGSPGELPAAPVPLCGGALPGRPLAKDEIVPPSGAAGHCCCCLRCLCGTLWSEPSMSNSAAISSCSRFSSWVAFTTCSLPLAVPILMNSAVSTWGNKVMCQKQRS